MQVVWMFHKLKVKDSSSESKSQVSNNLTEKKIASTYLLMEKNQNNQKQQEDM